MTSGMFVVAVVLGLVTGGLAGRLLKHGGHGRASDLVLGLMGSTAMTSVVAALGTPAEAGMVVMAGVAIAGAVLIVVTQRRIWPAARRS